MNRLNSFTRLFHFGAAFAFVLVLGFVAARHGTSMSPLQMVSFYGIPLVASALFLLAARAQPETRINALLLVSSLGVGLLFAEVALLVKPPPPQFLEIGAELGSPDTRTKFEVVRDLREGGVPALPAVAPWSVRPWEVTDTFAAVTTAPARATVVSCDEGEGWLEYVSDEYGFRNEDIVSADSSTTIAVLGDSFVFGQCVDESKTIPGQLRSSWPRTRNLGVSGSGPLHQLAVLREFGPVFRPEVVVWVFYSGNDLTDLREERKWENLQAYLTEGFRRDLPSQQSDVDEWLTGRLTREFTGALQRAETEPETPARVPRGVLGAWRLSRLRSFLNFRVSLPRENPLEEVPSIVAAGVETADSWGGKVVLVYLPEYRRYRAFGAGSVQGYQEFLALGDEHNIPVVDLSALFEERVDRPKELWAHPRGHLNAQGYAIAADEIEAAVHEVLR